MLAKGVLGSHWLLLLYISSGTRVLGKGVTCWSTGNLSQSFRRCRISVRTVHAPHRHCNGPRGHAPRPIMAEGHDGMPSKTRPLIDDARKFVQEKLVENLEYLSRSELKAYVKCHDENKGFTMMRDILPPEVSDDEIRNECRYLGNSLYHKS